MNHLSRFCFFLAALLATIGARLDRKADQERARRDALWDEADQEEIRRRILDGVPAAQSALFQGQLRRTCERGGARERLHRAEAMRSDVSRAHDGPLVEVWKR